MKMIIHHTPMTSEPAKAPKKIPEPSGPSAPDSLELRIRRLEEAVAGLQDTSQFEERVVERVSDKLCRDPNSGTESAGFLSRAGSHILPAALGLGFESFGSSATANNSGQASPRRAWWLFEAYNDLRSMVRMYSDQRYRRHMTWTAFLTPFVFLACVLLVWFWMPTSIPFLGPGLAFLDKVVDVLLAFFAYKILSRELVRYREMMGANPR
jgi:hypothetical protein